MTSFSARRLACVRHFGADLLPPRSSYGHATRYRVSGGRRHFALRLSAVAGPARFLPTGTTCLPANIEMRL